MSDARPATRPATARTADPQAAAESPLEVVIQAGRPGPASQPQATGDERGAFTVLHVVRNMGGGVATAIIDYAAAVPEAVHIVLCDIETSFEPAATFPFQILRRMPASARGAIAQIKQTVAEIGPDVIHAHSSFAGLYVRSGLGRRALKRVVYSPHCFAFFRRDVPAPVRAGFWLAEAALTLRAPAIITCSPDEERAARHLVRARTTYAPNVANVPAQIRLTERDVVPRTRGQLVVTVGRMCAQKDPQRFVDAVLAAREQDLDYDWLWIGGGDDEYQALFDRHRIPYTGWIPRDDVLSMLAQADVYLHTAAWEGAPLSVLEAAALKIPVLGRRTAALSSLGLQPLWRSTGELIGMLRDGPGGEAISQARAQGAELLAGHTAAAQRTALLSAYDAVLDRNRKRRPRHTKQAR